jgi:uncharacterized protein (UPF0216 family)
MGPERRDATDESVLTRWLQMERGKINRNIVTARKPLKELLSMKDPKLLTRSGEMYRFDAGVLVILDRNLPGRIAGNLKLPVSCYFDSNVPDSGFITDPVAMEALKILGELSNMRTMTGDRLWIGKPIIYCVMRKYPTVIQIIMK